MCMSNFACGTQVQLLLDNVKIVNLKRKNKIIKVPKQDEDAGNLQILLHLRSLF